MKLKAVILKNFRAYSDETRINVSDITAFVGANDAGKSTILEALEIFFNNKQIRIDANDACVRSVDKRVTIGCVFSHLQDNIIIDNTAETTLSREYLLNKDGDLQIHKTWDVAKARSSEEVFAYAVHPTANNVSDLLQLKITDLRKRAESLGVSKSQYDARVSHEIRSAIRSTVGKLELQSTMVPLKDGGAKETWDSLRDELPLYVLFRSDRPSTDTDSEVQDPMNVAVEAALKSVQNQLNQIKDFVLARAREVANRTIEKLREINPSLASELEPHFEEPKWAKVFKLSLTGDDQIPINKRGSGTRRLILINFFRAEAERLCAERQTAIGREPLVIYAIEEPETSQHPDNQKKIIEALIDLASQETSQVILTTHVPGLAGLLPIDSIRYVYRVSGSAIVQEGEGILDDVAATLGVIPDAKVVGDAAEAKVLLFVEGRRDVEFLENISATLHRVKPEYISVGVTREIVICQVGGSNLKDWVFNHYTRSLGKPEVHIYDRDRDDPPKYQDAIDTVNNRTDGSVGFLTRKAEMENYIHRSAIRRVFGFDVEINDDTDVPLEVARMVYGQAQVECEWSNLSEKKKTEKIRNAKRRLNKDAATQMTFEEINEADCYDEIKEWLEAIKSRIGPALTEGRGSKT